jgi:hypothetical protein
MHIRFGMMEHVCYLCTYIHASSCSNDCELTPWYCKQRRKQKTASKYIVHACSHSHSCIGRKNKSEHRFVAVRAYTHTCLAMTARVHSIHAHTYTHTCTAHNTDSGAKKIPEAWCMHLRVHVCVYGTLHTRVAIGQGLENANVLAHISW